MPAKQSLTHGGHLPVALSPAVQPCGHRLRLAQLLTKRWSPRSLRGASPCAGLSFPLPGSVCAAHSAQACVPHSTRPTPCHNCPARRGGTVLLLQQERGAYRPVATNQLLGPAGPGGRQARRSWRSLLCRQGSPRHLTPRPGNRHQKPLA